MPRTVLEGGVYVVQCATGWHLPTLPNIVDMDVKLRDMEAMGIDRTVLSVSVPGPEILGGAEADDWAQHINDHLAAILADYPDKFVGSEEVWEEATNTLAEVAAASGLDLVPDPGGAAFYGPKISVQARDALGRSWQMSTIQLDFNFPERFELEYTAADGSRQRPVMIHRALFGSIERFFGILTEHYAGAFPAWLAPVQVVGIPVADGHIPYLNGLATQLKMHGIRAEVDASDDRMAKKIVHHTNQKVPFMLLAGDRDVQAGAVSFRFGDRTQVNGVPRDEAVRVIAEWIASRENAAPTAELLKVGTSK